MRLGPGADPVGRNHRGNPHRGHAAGRARDRALLSAGAAGRQFDADRIDRSLKALFATGLFTDVTLRREGDALIVRSSRTRSSTASPSRAITELTDKTPQRRNPAEAARRLYAREGAERCEAHPRSLPPQQPLRRDRRAEGHPAGAEPRRSRVRDRRRADRPACDGINFVGNHAFSASRLREVIQTKESRWYRFFSSGRHLRSRPPDLRPRAAAQVLSVAKAMPISASSRRWPSWRPRATASSSPSRSRKASAISSARSTSPTSCRRSIRRP